MARQSRHCRCMGIPQESGIIVERWAGFEESCKKAFKAFAAAWERVLHTLLDGSIISP